MKALSIQVTYRKGRPFAAYIYLGRRPGEKSSRTEQVADELVIDYGLDDHPIGIEVISPEVVTLEEILQVFDRLGIGRPDPSELAPLRAA